MMKAKTRMKRLIAEQAAAIRIHDRIWAALLTQLRPARNALVTQDDVLAITQPICKMVVLCRTLCDEIGTDSTEAVLNAVLGSADGERRGREHWELEQGLSRLFDQSATRFGENLLDLSLDDAALAHQYLALCRQAEAIVRTQAAMFRLCHVQFHVIRGRFGFAGQCKGG
jgi:hypothetical protein